MEDLSYDEMEFLVEEWMEYGIEEFNLSGMIVVLPTRGERPNYVVSMGTCKESAELLAMQREAISTLLNKLMQNMITEHRKGMSNSELFNQIGKILVNNDDKQTNST